MTTTETTKRPSINTITRRKMLRSVAVTSALAITASINPSHSVAAVRNPEQASPELLDLIRAHRAAWESLGDCVNAADSMHPDYAGSEGEAIWEMRNDAEQEALQLVLAFPVHTLADAQTKAFHLLSDDFGLETHNFKKCLSSLLHGYEADDEATTVAHLGSGRALVSITDDPTLAALTNMRTLSRTVDRAYDAYNEAENAAESVLGRRPWSLIAWRSYSAIGGSELERARDDFLRRGIDPALVEAEYQDAKNRQRQAVRNGQQWDRKAKALHLRRAWESGRDKYRRSLWRLARTTPTTVNGAAAMAAWLAKELAWYDEKYHAVAAKSIARGLRAIAGAGAA
jgi:hypothetical protein